MWVIQEDLFQQNQRPALVETLQRFAIPHQIVSVTARAELIPDVVYDGPIISNGSVLLSKIANQRGWQPGSFLNEQFSYDVWHPHYQNYLLNRDAVFTTIATADPSLDVFFIRPLLDNKSFTGRVMTRSDFKTWQIDTQLAPETEILYAPVKHIGQEHRHFIVNGIVVSSSRYKLGKEANQSAMVDPYIIAFATRVAGLWQPANAFVLDTYITDDEIGIVEIGCIGHAGFYQADVQKIVMALDEIIQAK
jgi:hypothetical protein